MTQYYETTRQMQGASVGTILPWVGNASSIPDGWLQCTGQTLEATEYPLLASVLGNTYGPTGGLGGRAYGGYVSGDNFRLPNLNGRVLTCLLYTSPSPRDRQKSRMPSSA